MALFKFLKTPNPSQYDYKPRFWDPEKERIERRLAELKARKEEATADDVKGRLSGSFRSARNRGGNLSHTQAAAKRRSNFTLIAIILALGLLAYVLLNVNSQIILDYFE